MITERKQRSFLDPQILARLAALPLMSRRPMLGQVSGRHSSPHRGASVEFAEYRKYVPGMTYGDWIGEPSGDPIVFYVKEFEADTNLRLCLVVDTSGSMDAGSVGLSKLEYARRIAATLAYLAVQQGDAVGGLACVANKIINSIPPKRNPAHLTIVFDGLEQAKASGETQLDTILHELAETIRQRALIVILSDLFSSNHPFFEVVSNISRFRKHDVAAFHLLDPEELSFTFQRPTRFVDLEGGPSIFAEPSEIADRYHKALATYLDEMKKVVLETGVDYRRISIDAPFETSLTEFLVDRARGKGHDEFPSAMVVARPATPFSSHHHPLDQSVALPDQTLGRDDVLVGRQSNGPRLREDSTILDSRHAYAGHPRFDLRDQSSFGQRTPRALRRKNRYTTIVLLDRSPSMQERGENGIDSKFTTAKRQLRETLQTLGSNRWVLIDSAPAKAAGVSKRCGPLRCTLGSTFFCIRRPARYAANRDRILEEQSTGQTEIWICSDLRQSIGILEQQSMVGSSRCLSAVSANRAIAIDFVRREFERKRFDSSDRRTTKRSMEVKLCSLSLMLVRDEKANQTKAFPVQVEVNGARSELPLR